MANPEARYCTPEEYKQGKKERVFIGDLALDGLYNMMTRLGMEERTDRKITAFEVPARVNEVKPGDTGIYVVEFDLLSDDLTPSMTVTMPFRDGYLLVGETPEAFEKGYFRNHRDFADKLGTETGVALWEELEPHVPLEALVEAHLP